jgi:hypothetical protein
LTAARAAEIQRLLRERASYRHEEFSATLSWFLAEGLALRLGMIDARRHLLLRGDLMLHALLEGEAPYEWDAELLDTCSMSASVLARTIREACNVEVDDGLDLELPVRGISERAQASGRDGVAMTINGRLGAMQLPLQIFVGTGVLTHEGVADYRFASLLGPGLNARVTACPPDMAAADLIQTIVNAGIATVRPKLHWDLYRLIASGQINAAFAPRAVEAMFRSRGTPLPSLLPLALSEEFSAQESRRKLWETYLGRARVDAPALADVIAQVRNVAWPWIQQATLIAKCEKH